MRAISIKFMGIYMFISGILPHVLMGQPDRSGYREQLNQWHQQHAEIYTKVDSVLNTIPTPRVSIPLNSRGIPATYEFICQDMFLSGTNLAWKNFGNDIGFSGSQDLNYFNNFFAAVKAAGGNSVRLWLHTDACFTPQIETNGNCTGLHHRMTNQQIIAQMEEVLDAAYKNGILVGICLFSFDMLQDASNKGWTDIDVTGNYNFLTSAKNVDSYIQNALTPMVNALKNHPALLCWEVFNEPEGMTAELGWTGKLGGQFVSMSDIQMVVNKVAGAIHRLDHENPVTNGCYSFIALSDVAPRATQNYYRDDRLIAAGGDPDGTLDFYQVHFYSWAGKKLSPFHNHASYWGLDKPIMVAEFHVEETFGVDAEDLYQELFQRGYFGAWGWQYNQNDLWELIQTSMTALHQNHSSYIDFNIDHKCISQKDH